MQTITIHHIRPGKQERSSRKGSLLKTIIASERSRCSLLKDSRALTERLCSRGFIEAGETVHSVAKFYPFNEPFNLLIFGDGNGDALGYYSDIALPIRKVQDGYELVDLFLDIWLKPDGTLLELDLNEFQAAIAKGLVTPAQEKLAVTAFERLKAEAKQGIYPWQYLKEDLEK